MNPRSRFLIALALAAGIAGGFASTARAGLVSPDDSGAWQKHEYNFRFMGFTTSYSCDGLADQLKRLLIQSGARADAKASPGACASGFGRPDKFASARLTFYTLAPGAAGAADDAAAGSWQPVALEARRPTELQVGDCELVEQFRDEVLKKMFAIRNLADHTRCVPHQESGSLIDTRFDVFVATAGAPARVPAATAFAYPKSGQSKEQQAKDRAECGASAASQTGYDPATGKGNAGAYNAALAACLEPRGYAVR